MQRSSRAVVIAALLATLGAPLALFAQSASSSDATFSREGIYGCNQNGAYAMSVGTINAVTGPSGTYVPVNDSAVTSNTAGILLNTGTLVYKECVLREVVDRMAESALTALQRKSILSVETSRDGGPMYPRILTQDILKRNDDVAARALTGDSLEGINPAFRDRIKRTYARAYMAATRASSQSLACPYQGDIEALTSGDESAFSVDGLMALGNPACNPVFAYEMTRQYIDQQINSDTNEMMTRLQWGNGFYGVETTDAQGNRVTRTPGALVQAGITQAVTSGYRRLENANDIGQMVGALFAGLSTQMISSGGGLQGITQSTGGQPSYLDKLTKESSDALISSAVNAALRILAAARQVEVQYNQAVTSLANLLTQTIQQLRSTENQCWTLIIQKVCTGSVASSSRPMTCTDSSGNNYQISTSTAASQAIIDAQIAPLASTTVSDLAASDHALTLIDQLIQGVANTTSVTAQRLALQELDRLVATHALHAQPDLTSKQSQLQAAQVSLATLVTDTVTAWGDSTDPNIGWCNVNEQSIVDLWKARWRK